MDLNVPTGSQKCNELLYIKKKRVGVARTGELSLSEHEQPCPDSHHLWSFHSSVAPGTPSCLTHLRRQPRAIAYWLCDFDQAAQPL